VLLLLLGCVSSQGFAQQTPPQTDRIAKIQKLFEAGRWDNLIREVESTSARGAEIDFYYGSALAHLGRWDAARSAFLAGQRLRPRDERFPIELGGVAFKQKRYSEAVRWLRKGLQLKPRDPYATNFLATVYFLQGNIEAALKYWNRIGKPQVENVRIEPGLRVDPVLLDRAFAFTPAAMLRRQDFLTTQVRVDALGIFPTHSLRLDAREDGRFDVSFQAQERNGWGNGKWDGLLSTFRGAFYETIYPDYFNLGRSGINLSSLARWDIEKRRLSGFLSGPLALNPKYRYQIGFDLRNENWVLRQSSVGPAPARGALNLRRNSVNGEIASLSSGRWGWLAGAELSERDYRNVLAGSGLPPQVLSGGYQLKQFARLSCEWLRVPERRFESQASVVSETGTIWAAPAHSFEKVQGSVTAHWLPQVNGDDYAVRAQVRSARTVGSVPFDELFMLGLERDNDLWMRAHIGTRAGQKGSAPLGRDYSLFDSEIDKNVYRNGLVNVKLSPFFDLGEATDPLPGLGSRGWLRDTGVQAKLRVLGVGLLFIYGRDLRSGKNTFYVTPGR
jgi:tetratricopeptide (TPR) repeat protein